MVSSGVVSVELFIGIILVNDVEGIIVVVIVVGVVVGMVRLVLPVIA